MARAQVLEPTSSSIEEWLGRNTEDYSRVLALTGGGRWDPGNDAGLWVKCNLRAHHLQAQTLQRRFREAGATWTAIHALIAKHGLPERVGDPLFDAILGYRVRRPGSVKRSGIEASTATRDLSQVGACRSARGGRAGPRALLPGQPTPAPHRRRRPLPTGQP